MSGATLEDLAAIRPRWAKKIQATRVEGVTTPGECWLWQGATSPCGSGGKGERYGRLTFEGRTLITHRAIYQVLVGPIPDGLQLDHLCRQTTCCAPHHLEPVTAMTNCRRGVRGARTHCARAGHPLDGDNLRITVDKRGYEHRVCRQCNKEAAAAWRLERAERQKATWSKYLPEAVAS